MAYLQLISALTVILPSHIVSIDASWRLFADEAGTSKHGSNTYGRNGRFLFSLSSVSLLSITSCRKNETLSDNLVLHRSHVISRQLAVSSDCGTPGTIVTVHNLFGDVPVRFKQQAARFSTMIEIEKQFEALKKDIIAYLLASPKCPSVRLSVNGTRLQYVHRRSRDIEQSFSLRKVDATLSSARLGPVDAIWRSASAKSKGTSIRAALCLTPSPSNSW